MQKNELTKIQAVAFMGVLGFIGLADISLPLKIVFYTSFVYFLYFLFYYKIKKEGQDERMILNFKKAHTFAFKTAWVIPLSACITSAFGVLDIYHAVAYNEVDLSYFYRLFFASAFALAEVTLVVSTIISFYYYEKQ